MKRLFQYLKKYRTIFYRASVVSIIHKLFDMMPPFLTGWLIDSVSGNIPMWISQGVGITDVFSIVIFLAVLTFVIFGFESLTEWLYKRDFMRLAQHAQHDLRVHTYTVMQDRELAFFEEQRTGNLMSILNNDVNQLERFLNYSFNDILQMIVLFLFAGWSLCQVSLLLGMITMLPIPFIILGSIYYQGKIAPHYKRIREAVGTLSNRLENNISGIQVIKSFGAEAFEQARVQEESSHYRDMNFAAIGWSSAYIPIIRMFIAVGFTLTLLIGAKWVLEGHPTFTLGSLAFFAMMSQRLLWPITRLGSLVDDYERAKASIKRVFGLLDTPKQLPVQTNPQKPTVHQGIIELDQVSFHYKNEQAILQNISTIFEAGKRTGIVGTTGAGKTTLIKLLLRFYDVKSGTISLNNVDLKALSLSYIRQQIALVSQDVYLFHGTIYENIAYGVSNCSLEKVVEVAKQAQLHKFVMSLNEGYDSWVGERGIKLSGGQRQRLSIARAILKNAPILILDEATSAVDTETEALIQQQLKQLTQNKTAIIIAHRLSTIRDCDNILVLEHGQILEQGTHPQLLQKGGKYADLWGMQLS